MANEYYKYSQKHFEYELKGILLRNKAGFVEDITNEFNGEVQEHVYKVSTANRAVSILIYSSVSVQANKVRDIATDAVRIVLRWKTKYGYMYKRICKHYRLKTLFGNLERTIIEAQQQVFNLKWNEFRKEVEA